MLSPRQATQFTTCTTWQEYKFVQLLIPNTHIRCWRILSFRLVWFAFVSMCYRCRQNGKRWMQQLCSDCQLAKLNLFLSSYLFYNFVKLTHVFNRAKSFSLLFSPFLTFALLFSPDGGNRRIALTMNVLWILKRMGGRNNPTKNSLWVWRLWFLTNL